MTVRHVPTRVLVLSDTHSALPDPIKRPGFKFSPQFPEADVAIHCGDLTSCGRLEEHKRALALLKSLPAPIKIVVPGNHDLTLDPVYLRENHRLHGWRRAHTLKDLHDAVDVYTNHEAKEAGIRFIIEGLNSFTLPNGAKLTVYASAFTPEFCNWGFAYPRSCDRFNTTAHHKPDNPVPSFTPGSLDDQVTIMVTHGPPRGILDKTLHGENVGCDHLMTAVSRCRPLLHCFGHIHEARGSEIRLWPGDAENGGAIGSEAAELRRSSEPGTAVHVSSSSADPQSQHREKEGQEPLELGHGKSRSGGELQELRMVISHSAESLQSPAPDAHRNDENVSVVNATALEYGKQTVFINASIMDIKYIPRQWPWLVQLELPRASSEETESP